MKIAEKSAVIVSRQWHKPEISIDVTQVGIEIALPLDDFLQALAVKYGNPASTVTQAQHLERLRAAAAAVADGMKRETTRVI